MKFNLAWSETASQNVTLKVVAMSLSVCVLALLVVLSKLSLQEPLIVERACYSTALEKSSPERTEKEISAFLGEALRYRFDTDALPETSLLFSDESKSRDQEQKELKEKGIVQRILFNKISKIDGTRILLDSDRLISIGPVRSVLAFPLTVTIASVRRTQGNPYGLRLMQVKPLEGEKKNEK